MNRDARTWAGRMILLSALTPALGAWATSFVVNTTADSGPGSLRAAINAANSNSLPAVITFDIPGTGTQTIALQTPLASLAVPVTIDAATQPGYAGTPLVDIDGTALTNGSGLDVFASSVVISGLGIVNCTNGWGVIGSSCSGLVISNCSCRNDGFSGIDLSSCSSSVIYGCNVSSNGQSGIVVDGGASNTVQNCVASGNTAGAFALELFTCTSSTVLGCNVSGNDNGMFIYGGASNTVQNCVVGGNSGSGVFLENENGSSLNNNWFGVDASGDKLVTPQGESISIYGCLGVVVGGNVFAGDYLGTLVYSSTNSLITNNTFGFLADGITPGDNPTGVQIESGSVNTWVSTCAFGLCHFSGIAVGFSGELAPYSQGTWVSSCVFGANAATGFPWLNHEFQGGPIPTNTLDGPGCTAPAIQDHDGINTICVDNLCYNDSATCFEAAPGVNTTFDACLRVGASSGICISAADGVPAPVITQVLSSGSSLTPTISLAGAQPNAVYTCWLGYNTNGDNEMLHYIGAMTVPTDSTGAGLGAQSFAVSLPTGATVYAYALAPGGGTSLRSAGLAPGACPPIQLQLTMVDDGAVGNTNFQFNVTASGGTPPYTFMLLGSIPIPGVSLSGVSNNTAIYRGPPTQAGTFPIVISATDSNGCQGLQTYSITINPAIVLTPQQLGTGTIGLPYNQTIYVLGGSPPYSFSAGSFPGVSLVTNSDGNAAGYCVLSGIPTSAGNFPITVSVTDSNADSATEHYTNLTVLFPPQLQLIQVDGGVSVWWPGAPAAGPFILQSTPQLSNAVWTDILTTFASPIQLPMTGSNAFFRVLLPVIPLDLTDYNKDRPAVAQYYSQDPQTYWAQFGLPSLSRLGNLQISLGGNPTNAFGGVLTAFDPLKFGNALQAGLLPLDFSNVVYSSIQSGNGTNLGVVNGFCSLVSNLDSFIVNSDTNGTFVVYQEFNTVYTLSFQTNQLTSFAPGTNKPYKFLPVTNNIKWVDVHGDSTFTSHQPPFNGPGSGNTNTNTHTPWGQITYPSLNVSYDAACAALATGASLAKMDPVFPKSTTPQFWNEFSMQLGASTTTIGAPVDAIDAYYNSLGFSSVQAYDGPFESALQEAYNALARGCDVTLEYLSADGKDAHIEMVTAINMMNSQQGTVQTLSWGQTSSTTYTSGQWSGKEDGSRYGSQSWLNGGSGRAIFYYHCPQ